MASETVDSMQIPNRRFMSLSEMEAVMKHLFLAFCLFGTICASMLESDGSMPESAGMASAGGLQVSDKIELQSALLISLEQGETLTARSVSLTVRVGQRWWRMWGRCPGNNPPLS